MDTHKYMNQFSIFPLSFSAFVKLVAALLLVVATPAWAKPADLPFFSAEYDATIKGIKIKATREFRPLPNDLTELHFSASSWLASLNESSQFAWDEGRIRPIRFTYRRKTIGKTRHKQLTFDWPNSQIISTNKDTTHVIAIQEQVLDRLNFQLQLQYDMLQGKQAEERDSEQTQAAYLIADKDRIKAYQFEVLGEELINTPLGELQTLKLKVVRENQKRVTYLWLAKDWYNLLARLEQHEDGNKEFEIQLTAGTVDGKAVAGRQAL